MIKIIDQRNGRAPYFSRSGSRAEKCPINIAKVDMHDLVIGFYWTPIFEQHMARCGLLNNYHKDICLREIGLYAQNMIIIP